MKECNGNGPHELTPIIIAPQSADEIAQILGVGEMEVSLIIEGLSDKEENAKSLKEAMGAFINSKIESPLQSKHRFARQQRFMARHK